MKNIILFFCGVFGLVSCSIQNPQPDPLDEPGYIAPTVAELHKKNLGLIEGDPSRYLR